MEVSLDELRKLDAELSSNLEHRVAQNAITSGDVLNALAKRDVVASYSDTNFSTKLKEGKATSQKASGRCWLFAALNVMRMKMREKYQLPESFELSQSYVFFWDKVERCNYFFNAILDTFEEELDSRLMQHLLSDPLGDGGQWDMCVNLIAKYGVVPKTVYPESTSSSASRTMNRTLTTFLRQYAGELRKAHADGADRAALEGKVKEYMKKLYRIVTVHLGTPPATFNWNFADKDKKFHSFEGLTPVEFYKQHACIDLNDYVSLIHDPRNPRNQLYTVRYLGNVTGGIRVKVKHLNIEIDEVRAYCKSQLDEGEPVWFGCDVGKEFHRKQASMDTALFDYDAVYGVRPEQNKEDRLRYGQSLMTHAMVFTGYHVQSGNDDIVKWRVENSWGTDSGDAGYYRMSNDWFTEYVYQIVCPRDKLQPEHRAIVDKDELIELPPWDPMGSLAC
eukprot:TRINITY_DN5935_c0_g1_i3.p1 TRINITY_DN5935_c0_g1~~TRINITY_DN5935_c0_g1_i3.p1  ORF type:complete len:460 (+),score=126.03 TRINITY_DN5935_c0_g1_i3:38-1381(+)